MVVQEDGSETEILAIAYIKSENDWVKAPSKEYIAACQRNSCEDDIQVIRGDTLENIAVEECVKQHVLDNAEDYPLLAARMEENCEEECVRQHEGDNANEVYDDECVWKHVLDFACEYPLLAARIN